MLPEELLRQILELGPAETTIIWKTMRILISMLSLLIQDKIAMLNQAKRDLFINLNSLHLAIEWQAKALLASLRICIQGYLRAREIWIQTKQDPPLLSLLKRLFKIWETSPQLLLKP